MKKIVIALFAIASLALFVACKKEDSTTKPTETKPTETKPTETKPAETKPAETKPAEGAGEMPAACKEYSDKFLKCIESDKYPAAGKDAAKQAFEQMKTGWNFSGMEGAAAKAAMDAADSACKQAIDAMKQGGEMMCPGVW